MTISFDLEQMSTKETTFKVKETGVNCDEENFYNEELLQIAKQVFVVKMCGSDQIGRTWRSVLQDTTENRKEVVRRCFNHYFIPKQDSCQKLSDKNLNDIINICTQLFNNNEIVEYKQTEVYNTAINMYFSTNPHIDIDINFESVISISVLLYFLVRSCRAFPLNKRRRHSKRYYS